MVHRIKALLNPQVILLFNHFSACFGMRILFLSVDGELVAECTNRPDSQYCRWLRQRLSGERTCKELDAGSCRLAARDRALYSYRCHAGLVEAVKPIFVAGQLLGYVIAGQLRTSEAVPEDVAGLWSIGGFWDEELKDAYGQLGYADENKVESIMHLFSVVVDYIVASQMVGFAETGLVDAVLSHIGRNPARGVTLKEAAGAVGRSPSTISHAFTKVAGGSFKRHVVDARLRQAEDYMRAHPFATVAEAAAHAGFVDPLYFSRVYKRYRGQPPSAFKAGLHKPS